MDIAKPHQNTSELLHLIFIFNETWSLAILPLSQTLLTLGTAQNPVSMDIKLVHDHSSHHCHQPISNKFRLFESGEFADCKVTCKDWEFETHRLILSSRSQYFCKALNGEWEVRPTSSQN